MMTKIQRVKKAQLWSPWKIAAIATLLAVVGLSILFSAAAVLELVFLPQGAWWVGILAIGLMCMAFLVPAGVAIRFHPRFRRWWHGFLFGAVYGGVMLPIAVLITSVISYLGYARVRPPPLSAAAGVELVLLPLSGGLFVLLWLASRTSRGKLLVTDNTHCPNCEYNLIGNTTYICPECGEPFTLEELEITSKDLDPIQ